MSTGKTINTLQETTSASNASKNRNTVSSKVKLQSDEKDELLYNCMYRLTSNLPQHELKLIAKEALLCEEALKREIQIIEKELGLPVSEFEFMNSDVLNSNNSTNNGSSSSTVTAKSDDNRSTNRDDKANDTTTPNNEKNDNNNDMSSRNAQNSSNPNNANSDTNTNIMPVITLFPPEYDPTSKPSVQNYLSTTDQLLANVELTPIDRYFTVSALLGRLRDPFNTPPPPLSSLGLSTSLKKTHPNVVNASISKYKSLLSLPDKYPIYTQNLTNDKSAMFALMKRISNHRTATVFRRPVLSKEAPGYDTRILFPIDLSLIKKLIGCGDKSIIHTFQDLHGMIGLICHNCVKFNGRESDYAMLTKDFELYVDEAFLDVMNKLTEKWNKIDIANQHLQGSMHNSASTNTTMNENGMMISSTNNSNHDSMGEEMDVDPSADEESVGNPSKKIKVESEQLQNNNDDCMSDTKPSYVA